MKVTIITPITTELFFSEDEIRSLCRDGLTVSDVTLSAGPSSIESRVDEAFAVPGMIVAAEQAERDGAQALVISCMGDPGLGPVRETVDIPVVGVAQTSMAVCASLAHSFGVVTVLDRLVPLFHETAVRYGYERHYAGCRSVDIPVLDLQKRMGEVQGKLNEQALDLVRQGAGGIILGCGGLLGCAEAIRAYLRTKGYNVPVVDPLPTTVSFVATLIRNGLSHSQVSFPRREVKSYRGYEFLNDR